MNMDLSEGKIPHNTSLTCLRDYGLKILQPREGYRFSVDSLLLAEFAKLKKRAKVVELGAGCGVISMILAKRYPESSITAVEIQEGLYRLLEANIQLNLLRNIQPLFMDMKKLPDLMNAGAFHHVIANPPFRRPESGRLCLDSQEALSRHEILINLEELLDVTRFLLKPGGRCTLIYPAERISELIFKLCQRRLEPKRFQFVHPDMKNKARLVLVEGVKDAGSEAKIEAPLFMNQ